ncbi:MAG: hypothetical protein HC848_04580 [Limnobacter sp.]|nr:hypothetical protein [Limnobacter sp.]
MHPSLNGYGSAFASWLATHFPNDTDVPEVAQLDWTLRRAFDGANSKVLTQADLAHVPEHAWEQVRFEFVPTASCLQITSNAVALWQALSQNQQPPQAGLLQAPATVLVWRREHQPHFRTVCSTEAWCLGLVMEGGTFGELGEHLSQYHSEAEAVHWMGHLLGRWVTDCLLAEIKLPEK